MNTLFKVLAGVTLLTLIAFPLGGVFADPYLCGTSAQDCYPPNVAATTQAQGCDSNCRFTAKLTSTTGGTAGTTGGIAGVQPDQLPPWGADEVIQLVAKVINWIFTFLMIFVVIMVVVSGFLFVTGGGNPDNVTKARNTLMYALVGFAVGMLAKGLIALVQAFLGKDIVRGNLTY